MTDKKVSSKLHGPVFHSSFSEFSHCVGEYPSFTREPTVLKSRHTQILIFWISWFVFIHRDYDRLLEQELWFQEIQKIIRLNQNKSTWIHVFWWICRSIKLMFLLMWNQDRHRSWIEVSTHFNITRKSQNKCCIERLIFNLYKTITPHSEVNENTLEKENNVKNRQREIDKT